jgi:hypothetical protein
VLERVVVGAKLLEQLPVPVRAVGFPAVHPEAAKSATTATDVNQPRCSRRI